MIFYKNHTNQYPDTINYFESLYLLEKETSSKELLKQKSSTFFLEHNYNEEGSIVKKYNNGSDFCDFFFEKTIERTDNSFTCKPKFEKRNTKSFVEKKPFHFQKIRSAEERELSDSFFFILLFLLIILALVKNNSILLSGTKIKHLFFNSGKKDDLFKTNSELSWLSPILFLLSFGLFSYKLSSYYNLISPETTPILFFFVSVLSLAAFLFLKFAFSKVFLSIMAQNQLHKTVLDLTVSSHLMLGIILSLTIIFLSYFQLLSESTIFFAGFGIILIAEIFKILYLGLNFLEKGLSFLFIILYFCILEIMPLVVLFFYFKRLIFNNMQIEILF